MIKLTLGDCIEAMRELPDCSVDSIVCDPPYGLGFMGKAWDCSVPGVEWATECLRVLKPGGHLVAFGGTRTVHRLTCAIEDAGFEIRDICHWVYWSGFPKSHDISKAIDRAAGAEREVVGVNLNYRAMQESPSAYNLKRNEDITAPATDAARQWSGWGTALKPAIEPAVLARKPFAGTVAANVMAHGTGALNIDACRIAPGDEAWPGPQENSDTTRQGNAFTSDGVLSIGADRAEYLACGGSDLGRFPANLYHCAKPSTAERERGTDGLPKKGDRANHHPTVKPVALMRWLCRLVTPPGGLVLDPFMGSGTTGIAAVLEGFAFHGIEREAEYLAIANARVRFAASGQFVASPIGAPEREQLDIFSTLTPTKEL